ncbi:MAG: hypothetical protein K2X93_06780 [Candidatus Obscuribacterales bacterium]|nr:hypothetical protein [Candidatus Obscuribacterales bacterium]
MNKKEAFDKLEELAYQGRLELFYLCSDEDAGGNYTPATYHINLTSEDDKQRLGWGTGQTLLEAVQDLLEDMTEAQPTAKKED